MIRYSMGQQAQEGPQADAGRATGRRRKGHRQAQEGPQAGAGRPTGRRRKGHRWHGSLRNGRTSRASGCKKSSNTNTYRDCVGHER